MLDLSNLELTKVKRQETYSDFKFSILIPSWNNIDYLKLCIKSIRNNSTYSHQIIIIINQGQDGSFEWVKEEKDLDYVYANENIGICYGLNLARSIVATNYITYLNDDMYVLPAWDKYLLDEIESLNSKFFMLSGTMIEPKHSNNTSIINADYGQSISCFNEELLLKEYLSLRKQDWYGSTWPPNVMHIDVWDLVGGMSIEFSPGMYSDPDLSMKLWKLGVRTFKGIAKSRVYHFGSVSTSQIKGNKGRDTFLRKWKITARFFTLKYLRRGENFNEEPLIEQKVSCLESFKNKLKLFLSIIS